MKSYARGANVSVRKPLTFADFVEAARTLCLVWLMLSEPPPAREDSA